MREADIEVGDAGFEAMGIAELIAMGREAGFIHLEELECQGTGAIVQVEVESRYDEARLDALDCVDRWEYVTETDAGHLYIIDFTAPELPDHLETDASELLGTCDPEIGSETTSISLVGRQETIASVVEAYQGAGVSTDLQRLTAYEGTASPLDDLTDRQREVIMTAHELGFYEVPREVSSEDIADALDLDPSTVAEHLQRAERNLFGELLS